MTSKTETLRYEAVDMIEQMVLAHCQNADVPRPKLDLLPAGDDEKIITIQVKADNRVTERSWYYTTMDLDGIKDAAWSILSWSHPDIFEE